MKENKIYGRINFPVRSPLYCLGLCLLSVAAAAQEKKLNMPPGKNMHAHQQFYDLSYKLKNIKPEKEIPQKDLQILKEIPESRLGETSAAYQAYVAQGNAFIQSLSPRVRNIFTETELWYIYATDPELTNEISAIR